MHRINVCLKLWKAHASLALFKISLLNQWSKLGMFKQMLRFLAAVVKLYDFEEGGVICLVVCYNRYENFQISCSRAALEKKTLWFLEVYEYL